MSQRDPSRLGRRLEALAEASAARGDVTRSLLEYEDAIDAHAADRDWPSADATAATAIALGRTHGVDMTAAIARRATLASRFERPEARALWLEVDAAAQACGDDRLRAQALVHAARTERADCELLLEAASLDPATNGWAARAANIIAMASADWDAAARHARVAGDLAREARDRNLEAQAAWGLSLATGNLGDDAAALEACRRAIYLLSELHETAQAEYARAGYVDLLAEALRLGDAETESRHLLFTTQAAGLDELTPIAVALRALTLLRAGRLDEAHELLLDQGCPDAGLDQRALLAVVAAHVAVDRSGPSMDALAAVDAADAACDAAGIETYAIEAGIARIALDLASGIDDEALGTARALRLTEPLAAGRLALLLARHASVEGTACDRLVGDLARVLATSSSPWAELGGAELAAHDARDADALRACAARWRAAGFVLDAARVDHAAVRTEMRA
ncbi:MAG: hypothetical protein JWM98_1430, partial [Thermoleophilia bacterium]|nr:hypothetical protein [Thermoleophilia bacterium]